MKKLRGEVEWELTWFCQLIVNTVDENILATMKDAGCSMISYGFESYSPIVLKSMRKAISPQQIDFALKNTMKHKMTIQANFIFGDVAETKESARITLDYWKENCEGQVWLDFIQPYPGSEIYAHCINRGLIRDKLEFIRTGITRFSLNMTDNMSEREFRELRKEISHLSRKYHRYVKPTSILKKGESESIRIKCPFCAMINEYNHCKISNHINFGFHAVCRHCYKRFQVVSYFQYIVYRKMRGLIVPYLSARRWLRLLVLRKRK